MRKGCADNSEIAILPQFLTIEPHFVRKVARTLLSFGRSNLISCEKGSTKENRAFTSFFDDRPPFRAKGLRSDETPNRNFTSVLDDRTSFRARRVAFRDSSLALPPA